MKEEQTATVTPKKAARILVHTKNEEDQKILADNFDLTKLGKPVFVHGLMEIAKNAIVRASAKGTKIITTGIPLDLAGSIKEVTLVRAWDKTREDGTRTRGATAPTNYFASNIVDQAAFEKLKASPEFIKAFGSDEEEPEEPAI